MQKYKITIYSGRISLSWSTVECEPSQVDEIMNKEMDKYRFCACGPLSATAELVV